MNKASFISCHECKTVIAAEDSIRVFYVDDEFGSQQGWACVHCANKPHFAVAPCRRCGHPTDQDMGFYCGECFAS